MLTVFLCALSFSIHPTLIRQSKKIEEFVVKTINLPAMKVKNKIKSTSNDKLTGLTNVTNVAW